MVDTLVLGTSLRVGVRVPPCAPINNDMKIKVFSHAVDLYGETPITYEQTVLLEDSGLLAAAQEVNMMLHYDDTHFQWLKDRWSNHTNVKYKSFSEEYRSWFEATTIHHIQELCHSTNEEFYVLYIHHKAITSKLERDKNWREYLQYWNIIKWRECVQKLDEGYDTCGAGYNPNSLHPFYAGNIWWTKASYIRKCKRLLTPVESNFQIQFSDSAEPRFDMECWLGSGNPRWYDHDPGESSWPNERWYISPYEK